MKRVNPVGYLVRVIMKVLAVCYAVIYMRQLSAHELILEKYSSLKSAFLVGINLLLYCLRSTYSFRVTAICIEPTNLCNLHCAFCPQNGTQNAKMTRQKGFISVELVKKLVRENPSVETFTVAFLGEPTLHKNLPEIIKVIKKGGKKADLNTNGYRLSDGTLKDLFSSGVDTLNFSLDALGADFEAIRGFPYSHLEDCILRAVALKKKHGFATHIKIQGVVNERTRGQMAGIRERWTGVVDSVKFIPYRFLSSHNGTHHGCLEPWRGVFVLWDGRVVSCCYDYDGTLTLGNAVHQSLREIWNGPPMRLLRTSLLSGKRYPLCRQCALLPVKDGP